MVEANNCGGLTGFVSWIFRNLSTTVLIKIRPLSELIQKKCRRQWQSLFQIHFMKIIVPVDFTEVSVNAASFAVNMVSGISGAAVILYHVYENESEASLVTKSLQWLNDTFLLKHNLQLETRAEKGNDFIACLGRFARFEDADLVVMAVNKHAKLIVGNYSLQMVEQNICPVLVVPPDFEFTEVKNVAVACDFKDVLHTVPIVPVKKLLDLFKPNLHIVNVNSEIYISISEDYMAQKAMLEDLFAEYRPQFHFINTFDFHETLRLFVADKNIDLILTFPRKHGFINNLIKGNNTRKLVFETEVPVLAAH